MNIVKAIYYRAKAHICFKCFEYWHHRMMRSLDSDIGTFREQSLRAIYWLEQQLANVQKMNKELES